MEYYAIVGMVIVALSLIFTTYFVFKKEVTKDLKERQIYSEKEQEKMHELTISIIKLTGVIENMQKNDEIRDNRISIHGKEIESLTKQVDRHELRLNQLDNCKWKDE